MLSQEVMGQSLDPFLVEEWCNSREKKVNDALRALGGYLDCGFQALPGGRTIFTANNLCVEASVGALLGLRKAFGFEAGAYIARGRVKVPGHKHYMGHNWIRFSGAEDKAYFLDFTHGQILLQENSFKIGSIEEERLHLGYRTNIPPIDSTETWLEYFNRTLENGDCQRKALMLDLIKAFED